MPARLLLSLVLLVVAGQSEAAEPQFEVASVKQVLPGTPPPGEWRPARAGGRYSLRSASLKVCLQIAYHLMPYRITGPAWMESERYEIEATMPPDTPDHRLQLMLQTLLMERFQLKLRWEERETAVYALVAGKNGPKLQKTQDPAATPRVEPTRSGLRARNRSVEDLAAILMMWTDRPVIDATGLDGSYDFDLEWSEDARPEPASDGARPAMASMRGADAWAPLRALGAIGLRAEDRRTPLRFLVVDDARKVPKEN